MAPWPSKGGFSVAEVLVAGGLLALISTVFFAGVVPAMQREDWFSQKQDGVRGFLTAKQHLSSILRNVLLVEQPPFEEGGDLVLLQFHRPVERSTGEGELGSFDLEEVVEYDLSRTLEVRFSPGGLLFLKSDTEFQSPIWRLGEDSQATDVVIQPDLRRVDFHFQVQSAGVSSLEKSKRDYEIAIFVR